MHTCWRQAGQAGYEETACICGMHVQCVWAGQGGVLGGQGRGLASWPSLHTLPMPATTRLQGDPGVGKTLIAKAIAGEAKVPFYQMAGR